MNLHINRRRFGALAASLAAVTAFRPAAARAEPLDLARIVTGFPAGTTPDVLARKVGDHLAKGYCRSAIVDNRTGAGGQLAVSAVKGAEPDGATILLTPMSILGVYPHTYKTLAYDPVADLTPVSMGVIFDFAIGVGPDVPDSVKDINDLMAWFKAHPGKASIGSPATGSTLHFTSVMLARAAGVEITHIGYRGSNAAVTDMLGSNLPALCAPLGTFLNQPRLRVLATCGATRSRFTPDVPTLVEQGLPDVVYNEWYGFYLPAKAAPDVVGRLNAALREALALPDIVQTLATFGMEPAASTPEQLAQALDDDIQRWGAIVKSIGFTADN